MLQAKRFLLLACISAAPLLVTFFSPETYAHSPHDDVRSVAISPAYENDKTLFIYVFDELKRSTDGGHTWKNLEQGLDNTSALISEIVTSTGNVTGYSVFAATYGDGIYRSDDGGDHWQGVNAGLDNPDIRRLVLSPEFDRDRTLVAISQGGGLFVSTTAGDSWRQIANDRFIATSVSIIKDTDTTRLLAGTDSGDFYLSDGLSDSWKKQGQIDGSGKITDMSRPVIDNGTSVVFIGTESDGLYKTGNLGESFTRVPLLPAAEPKKEAQYITSVRAAENTLGGADIFVTKWHESAFFSTDGGRHWKLLGDGLKKDQQADEFETSHFYTIAVPPGFNRHGNAFVGGFSGLFKTADGAQSWIEMETRSARNVEGLAVSPAYASDRTIAVAAYDGGAYVSKDSGVTWVNHNTGLPSTHLWDIAIEQDAQSRLALYAASNPAFLVSKPILSDWVSNKLATTEYWKYVTANFAADSVATKIARRILDEPASPFPTRIATSGNFATDKTLFVGTRYKGVLVSTDGGSTWSHPWSADDGWVTSVKISPDFHSDGTAFAAVRERGFFVSTDGGENWKSSNSGLSALAVRYDQLGSSIIELSPEFPRDRSIYFGTADGLYLSTNMGKQWERLRVSGNDEREMVRAIGVSPAFPEDGTVFTSVKGRGLYKSTDRGQSFTAIAPELIRNHDVLKLFRFSPEYARDHTIFAASAEEAFVSHDSGVNWARLERPIRYEDTKDNIIYRGTWERTYNAASSAMNIHRSNTPGAQAIFHFTGKQVTWYGPRSNEYGTAKVYLDGTLIKKVIQSSDTPMDDTPIITIDEMSHGNHVLMIEVDDADATGRYIAIDALEVS